MAYLLYSALNREGQSIRRLGQYAALQDLDKELSLHGEELVDFHLLSDGIGRILESLRGKPKPLEIAEFCTTLSHYVAGGIELQGALADAAKSTSSSAMRSAIIDIRRNLKGGYSLSESMRMTGRFPDVVISMTRIGEEGGSLASTLRDAAQHIERVEDIKGAAKRAMVYPTFTLLVVVAAGAFWMTAVVPKIVQLFIVAAIPVSWILARRNKRFRITSDNALWRLPLIGRIVRGSQMAFYYQYLSLMYAAGVVITHALDTMQTTVSNKYFAYRVSSLLDDLRSGRTLADAFTECELFPLLDQRMVSIGEQTGNLEEQLDKLAEIHFNRVQALVEVLPKFVEPAMLLILGGCFAFFIIALLGPLYSMISNVGGV
jgi:type IV pilus assembly protein PilC